MAILLNGSSDPNNVMFNGTKLYEVVYNNTLVWEKFPSSISELTSVNSNVDAMLQSLTRTGIAAQNDSYKYGVYEGRIVGEIDADSKRLGHAETSGGLHYLYFFLNMASFETRPHNCSLYQLNQCDLSSYGYSYIADYHDLATANISVVDSNGNYSTMQFYMYASSSSYLSFRYEDPSYIIPWGKDLYAETGSFSGNTVIVLSG